MGKIDYAWPNITVVFDCNGTKITFSPQTLGKSMEWTKLNSAVENGTEFSISSCGTNSNYTIGYSNNIFNLSVSAYGSGMVGSLNVDIVLNEEIRQTLIELEKLSKCIENKVAYCFPN